MTTGQRASQALRLFVELGEARTLVLREGNQIIEDTWKMGAGFPKSKILEKE